MESQVLAHYEKDYIIQTLKYCKNYFKVTAVKQKGGFFLSALQEGYFKDEIQKESKKKEKKTQRIESQEIQAQEKEKMTLERNQKIEKLREEYLNNDFIEAVLAEHEGEFLYSIMENTRKQGKVNKFLQEYVDRKLLEEFGKSA